MKISASSDIDKLKAEEVQKYVALYLDQVTNLVNGNLSFADNFNAKLLTVTFSAANTDVASIHGLGRVPSGYFLVGSTAAMSIYDGASANTSSLLYLRSNATGTARLVVF